PGIAGYRKRLRAITKRSNALLFRVVDDISLTYTDGVPHDWTALELRRSCQSFLDAFLDERNAFVVRNQKVLLDALERDAAREPALAGNCPSSSSGPGLTRPSTKTIVDGRNKSGHDEFKRAAQ